MIDQALLAMARATRIHPSSRFADLDLALASMSETRGCLSLAAVQAWCDCDRADAVLRVRELYRIGYVVESRAGYLFQPQMRRLVETGQAVAIRDRNIARWRREMLLERDNHRCVHCNASRNLTFDHITPLIQGGENSDDNFQILCSPCNQAKGNRTNASFLFEGEQAEHGSGRFTKDRGRRLSLQERRRDDVRRSRGGFSPAHARKGSWKGASASRIALLCEA